MSKERAYGSWNSEYNYPLHSYHPNSVPHSVILVKYISINIHSSLFHQRSNTLPSFHSPTLLEFKQGMGDTGEKRRGKKGGN